MYYEIKIYHDNGDLDGIYTPLSAKDAIDVINGNEFEERRKKSKSMLDLEKPGIETAILMAEDLRRHCQEFNIPENSLIAGVAWDAHAWRKSHSEKLKKYLSDPIMPIVRTYEDGFKDGFLEGFERGRNV